MRKEIYIWSKFFAVISLSTGLIFGLFGLTRVGFVCIIIFGIMGVLAGILSPNKGNGRSPIDDMFN